MIYIIILVIIIIIIPKHNKAEKEAGHLFIDNYNIPVKKVRNPIRQMYILEKHFNISGIKTYQRNTSLTTLLFVIGGLVLFVLGMDAIGAQYQANTTMSLIFFFFGLLLMLSGVILSYVRFYKLHSKIRPKSWQLMLNQVDPKMDTRFLQHKHWQKALLVALVEAK